MTPPKYNHRLLVIGWALLQSDLPIKQPHVNDAEKTHDPHSLSVIFFCKSFHGQKTKKQEVQTSPE